MSYSDDEEDDDRAIEGMGGDGSTANLTSSRSTGITNKQECITYLHGK
jgi:hypothetical protein